MRIFQRTSTRTCTLVQQLHIINQSIVEIILVTFSPQLFSVYIIKKSVKAIRLTLTQAYKNPSLWDVYANNEECYLKTCFFVILKEQMVNISLL